MLIGDYEIVENCHRLLKYIESYEYLITGDVIPNKIEAKNV